MARLKSRIEPSDVEAEERLRSSRLLRPRKWTIISAEIRPDWTSSLEPDLNTCLIPEVTLVLISLSESVAKPSEHVVGLHRAEGDGMRERNVDAAAEHEVKCVVARIVDDAGRKLPAEVAIEARMRATKQMLQQTVRNVPSGT
jgi:hypothetical protein